MELEAENERAQAGLLSYAQSNPSYEYLGHSVVTKETPDTSLTYSSSMPTLPDGRKDDVRHRPTAWSACDRDGRHVSRVMSIIDLRSSVSGTVERTGDNGVVNGSAQSTGTDGNCIMSFLPLEAELVRATAWSATAWAAYFPAAVIRGRWWRFRSRAPSGKKRRDQACRDFRTLKK